jgi:hypothetical protein
VQAPKVKSHTCSKSPTENDEQHEAEQNDMIKSQHSNELELQVSIHSNKMVEQQVKAEADEAVEENNFSAHEPSHHSSERASDSNHEAEVE